MSTRKTGYYHIIDEASNRIIVTRKTSVIAESGQHYTAMLKKSEKDRLYMSVEKPVVDVTITENETDLILSIPIIITDFLPGRGNLKQHALSSCRCGNCSAPLLYYYNLVDGGITECPYCSHVFTHFRPNRRELNVCLNAENLSEEDQSWKVLPNFRLPYGYPVPERVSLETAAKMRDRKFTDTKEDIKEVLPRFFSVLYRHEKTEIEDEFENQEDAEA